MLPCGVADPGGRTGFVANAHGGIDAVDLATGDLLWDVDAAKRPALAEDDRLYAWAPVHGNGLRVTAFDRAKGGRPLLESEPVVFPDWVNVEDGPGQSFTGRWRFDKGRLILDWEARAWYSGAHPTPQAEANARRQAEGQVRIDVETGKVETAAAEQPAAPPSPPKDLEKAVVRWQGAAGDAQAALVLEEAEGRQTLSLWSWDAAKVNEPKELLTGKRLLALPTIDERFLCLRDASPSPDQGEGPDDRGRYGWSIFVADGGDRLAQVAVQRRDGVHRRGRSAGVFPRGRIVQGADRSAVRAVAQPQGDRPANRQGAVGATGRGQALLAAGAVMDPPFLISRPRAADIVTSCPHGAGCAAREGFPMKVMIRFTKRDELKALPILLRHSPGMVLPNRIYVVSPEAARALRDAGVRFTALGGETNPPSVEGAEAGERI